MYKTTNHGVSYPTSIPLCIVTAEFYCDCKVYKTALIALEASNRLCGEPTLICSYTDNLHLSDRNRFDIADIKDSRDTTLADTIANIVIKAYKLTRRIPYKLLHSLFFLDTSLCVMIGKAGGVTKVTRNPSILNDLETIGRSEYYEEREQLEIEEEDIVNGYIPVAVLEPTAIGYTVQYSTMHISDVTIIPYFWYQMFLNSLSSGLDSGCYEISIYNPWQNESFTATRDFYSMDYCASRAAQYIQHNPCNKLSELQFYDLNCKQIVFANIAEICSIDYLCGWTVNN